MITVHHLNNSRSHRVLWLLEELGLPYEVVRYQRRPDMLAPPELKQVHPLGKSPVISDDGRVVAESGAIIEYLLERYGPAARDGTPLVPPAGSEEKLRFTYWLHYAEGSAMPLLLLKLIFLRLPGSVPRLLRPVVRMVAAKVQQRLTDPQLATALRWWADELGRRGLVRRRRLHGGRHPDELSRRGRRHPRRYRRQPCADPCLGRRDQGAAGLPAGAGNRRRHGNHEIMGSPACPTRDRCHSPP